MVSSTKLLMESGVSDQNMFWMALAASVLVSVIGVNTAALAGIGGS